MLAQEGDKSIICINVSLKLNVYLLYSVSLELKNSNEKQT